MKKLIAMTAAIAASLFILAPTNAEAGYRSKVIGKCGGCGGNIYAYYKPVRLSCGTVRYSWVPSYHNTCRHRSSVRSISSFPSSRYVTRSYVPRSYGYVSRGSGFSIRFGSSRGYCR